MARRKAADTPQEGTATGLTLALRPSEGVRRAERPKEENPTLDAVRVSLTNGPQAFDLDSEESAKKVANYLRRAAQELGVGLSQSTTDHGNGVWTVDFEAKEEKRERKYTVDDIRRWYADTFQTDAGPAELSGPIAPPVREAFKIANGYAKGSVELHGATFTNE